MKEYKVIWEMWDWLYHQSAVWRPELLVLEEQLVEVITQPQQEVIFQPQHQVEVEVVIDKLEAMPQIQLLC